jgi:hypothetical protein
MAPNEAVPLGGAMAPEVDVAAAAAGAPDEVEVRGRPPTPVFGASGDDTDPVVGTTGAGL